LESATTFWLATNSGVLRERLHAALPQHPQLRLVGSCAADDASLERDLAIHRPQMLLMDWPTGGRRSRSLGSLRQVASLAPKVILLVDSAPDSLVETILKHRLHGYLLHNSTHWECARAIGRVSEGEIWISRSRLAAAVSGLMEEHTARVTVESMRDAARNRYTQRERQIVAFVRQGMTNKQIGHELGIVEDTVKKHLQHIYDKVGVRRRSMLAAARPVSSSRGAGWTS
jgi:DNA-binding NarL/FixJ family response regulator